MKKLLVKTTFVYPNDTFENYFYKISTEFQGDMVGKFGTIVERVSLESCYDQRVVLIAAKYDSVKDALKGHDEWVLKGRRDQIKFPEAP